MQNPSLALAQGQENQLFIMCDVDERQRTETPIVKPCVKWVLHVALPWHEDYLNKEIKLDQKPPMNQPVHA